MTLFKHQIAFVDDFEDNLFPILKSTISRNDEKIINYITEDQLFERGVDGNEKKLRGYARTTIRAKIRKGQPVDRTTLKDTGDFYKSFSIEANPDDFKVEASIEYTKYLTVEGNRYGIDILRPSAPNIEEFFEDEYYPELNKFIKQELR